MLMCILVYMFMFMFMLMFTLHENQKEHGLGHDMNMILNVDIEGDNCWLKDQSPAIGKSRIQEAKSKIYIFSDNFFENISFNIKIS